MKKWNWRKGVSLGLVLAMTLGMAACGGGGDKKEKNEKVNAELAKQNVYRYQEVELGEYDSSNGYRDILSSAISGDKVYLLFREDGYDPETYENYTKLTLYEMNKDGSDVKTIELQRPEAPAEDENAGEDQSGASQPGEQEDGSQSGDDAGIQPLTEQPEQEDGSQSGDDAGAQIRPRTENNADGAEENDTSDDGSETDGAEDGAAVDLSMPEVEEPVIDEEFPGTGNESYEYQYDYYGYSAVSDDRIYAYREHVKEGNDENGNYTSENTEFIDCWDLQGKLLFSTQMDMSKYQNDDTWTYVSRILSLEDGKAAILMQGDQQGLITVSEDGTLSDLKKQGSGDTSRDIFSNQAGSAVRSDGTMIVSYYDTDYENQYVTTYDPMTGVCGEEFKVPDLARYNGMYTFSSGLGKDVIFSANDGLYGFNLGDTETVKLMDYVNSDLPVYGLDDILTVDETSFFASFNDPVDYSVKFCLFSYVKPEDIPDKKVLVLAGIYLGSDIKQYVINFNKEDQEYRIVTKDYSMYNTNEDYTAGATKLNNDIIAGAIPDILCLSDDMPVDSMISQGLFADIDKLIKEDPELGQIEFMDNVFEAYRVDGVLYRVIPTFVVQTFIGKESLLGDRTSITMEELQQIAQNAGENASLFGAISRESFLSSVMSACGRDFVNVDTGKCAFDSDLFVSLLEYAKTLPTEDELWGEGYDEDFWNEYYENYDSQYRENRTLLMGNTLSDLTQMKSIVNGYFGEDVSYVGFPTESDMGSCVSAQQSYAISKKSANIDGAWKFLRFFLTEDYQKNEDNKYGYRWGLSVHKNLVRENANAATQKSFYYDGNGEKVEYDDTFYINGEEITINPLSQAQADELFDFVCSVTKPTYYSRDVSNIVDEEVQAFYSGQKTAKEAAEMIQNRVQLYVNENK